MRRLLSLFTTAAVLTLAGLAGSYSGAVSAQEGRDAAHVPMWWIFFTQGDNKTPLPKEEAATMQAGHIANLVRMYNEKKSPMAGPFGERGPMRGVVVLGVKNRADVDTEFKEDPFVKAGYLKVEAHRWLAPRGAFGKPEEPTSMAKFQFVLLKKGPNWKEAASNPSSAEQKAHVGYIHKLYEQGEIVLAGPFQEAGDLQGLVIFAGEDGEKTQRLISKDPHVEAGQLVAERKLLYIGKGVLNPKPAAKAN
jgi:uncharacterized protein YciI